MQFAYLLSLKAGREGPAESFSVLPGLRQASPSTFPQNLAFELGENSEQPSHGATRRSSEIERLGQGNESHAKMLQLLKCRQQICYRATPAVQSPYQHQVDVSAARRLQQFLAGFSSCRPANSKPSR